MKNGARLFSVTVAAGLVGFMSLAVQAKDYTGDVIDGVIAFGEITEDSTITIASGTTVTSSSAITGAGSLAISGGGTLVMAGQSPDYSGAITIDNTIVRLAAENPLGTGKVTLNGATARLAFDCNILTGKTIVNEFEVNDSTDSAQGFYFDNPRAYITFMGPLTVNGTLQLYGTWPDKINVYIAQFSNTVTVADTLLFGSYTPEKSLCYYKVCGRVNAKCLYAVGDNSTYSTPTVYLYCGDNSIGELRGFYKGNFSPQAVNALGGAAITKVTATRADLNLNGKDQTCAYVSMPYNSQDLNSITTSSAATLTLTGGVASATSSMYFGLGGALSLVIDDRGEEGTFTQTFKGGQNSKGGSTVMTIAGTIDVRRGNLAFTGSYKLASVPSISVDNGSFSLANTNETEKAFAGLTQLTIGANGSFSVNSKINPFPDEGLALDLTTGASITLTQDMTVDALTLNGVSYPQGTHTTIFGCTLTGGSITVVNGPSYENPVFIDVDAGETVTDPKGLTGNATLFKMGEGTLVLTKSNEFSGGSAIGCGIVEIQDAAALGSGVVTVYGSTMRESCLVFNKSDMAFANDIVVESASTLEHPALHFAKKTVVSGGVHAKADLYMTTAWGDDPAAASQENVQFTGVVTADAGACIGGAPHCIVSFKGVLTTPLLNCCYIAGGQASNGGNAGAFRIEKTYNDGIEKVLIDQTKFISYGVYACSNAVIEWSADHLADDLGRFEFYYAQKVSDFITPVIEKGGGGCVVTNIGSSAANFIVLGGTVARDCYARFDGLVNFQYNRELYTTERSFTFRNRRHLMKGAMSNNRKRIVIGEGASIPFVTGISNSNSCQFEVRSEEEDVLDGMTSVAIGSTEYTLNETAVKSLSKGRDVELTRTTGSLTLSGTSPLHVQKYYHSTDPKFYWPAGEYTQNRSATTFSYRDNGITSGTLTGTMLVWSDNANGTREGWTNMVWTGASATTDINDLDNWAELPQYATFKVPIAWVKFATTDKTEATLTNDVNWGGLTFTAESTGFTLKSEANEPTIHLYDNGLSVEDSVANGAGRVFTVEPTLDLQNMKSPTFKVPADDKLVLSGIISANFTADEENAGTIVLGGTIPDTLTIPAGRLEIAEGATLPEKFNAIWLGEGAQLDVKCTAGEIEVKSFRIGGESAVDGDYVYGNLIIRQRTGSVPTEPTHSATWTGGAGGDTSLTTAANWDAVPLFNAGALLNFAAAGELATVSGETMSHTLNFENLAEVADEGPTAFTLRGATENPEENVLTVYGKVSVDQSKVPLTLENMTLATPLHEDQGAPGNNGVKTMMLTSQNNSAPFPLTLRNAIVEKPIYATGPERRRTITAESGTNEIKGAYTYESSKWHDLNVSAGATLILSGGVSCNWKTAISGSGTLIITNKPWVSTQRGVNNGNGQIQFGGNLVWAVASNKLGGVGGNAGYQFSHGTVADYLCNDVFTYPTELRFYAKSYASAYQDLHSTTQRVGALTWAEVATSKTSANDAYFTGEEGSMLWLDSLGVCTNAFSFVGNLAFRKSGADECVLQRTSYMKTNNQIVQHTTTGPLLVDGGQLTLDEGVQWLNGNIMISGTGVLAVSENGQIGKELSLGFEGTDSQLAIPEGVTVRVASATVDGESVTEGVYTATNPGLFGDHLTGEGSLRVGKAGMMFIVK